MPAHRGLEAHGIAVSHGIGQRLAGQLQLHRLRRGQQRLGRDDDGAADLQRQPDPPVASLMALRQACHIAFQLHLHQRVAEMLGRDLQPCPVQRPVLPMPALERQGFRISKFVFMPIHLGSATWQNLLVLPLHPFPCAVALDVMPLPMPQLKRPHAAPRCEWAH